MNELGNKIAKKRKDLGMTQSEFAEEMNVTRQTVTRWEAGTVMPDIDKIGDIAELLGVSCDYLLKDNVTEEGGSGGRSRAGAVSRLLAGAVGRKCRFSFFDGETDVDLYDTVCTILEFEGGWVKISAEMKKGQQIEKLIPVSSVLSVEFVEEA